VLLVNALSLKIFAASGLDLYLMFCPLYSVIISLILKPAFSAGLDFITFRTTIESAPFAPNINPNE
jgi:hypothetical protein